MVEQAGATGLIHSIIDSRTYFITTPFTTTTTTTTVTLLVLTLPTMFICMSKRTHFELQYHTQVCFDVICGLAKTNTKKLVILLMSDCICRELRPNRTRK